MGKLLPVCCSPSDPGRRVVRLAVAQARWERMSGPEVAANTAVVDVASDVVTVGVPNEVWRARLERQRRALQSAFVLGLGLERRTTLRFEVVPRERLQARTAFAAPRPKRDVSASGAVPAPASPLTEGQAAALAALSEERDADLRGLFEGWMRRAHAAGPPAASGQGHPTDPEG